MSSKISIVTPALNAAGALVKTLQSLESQTVAFQHIIMDGGSIDDTAAVVGRFQTLFPIEFSSAPDEGLYDAIQKGFSRANGDIFGWLNAGDYYMPWTLSLVRRIFDEHPEFNWISGVPCSYYTATGTFTVDPFVPIYSRSLIRLGLHNSFHLPTLQQESMFWRRSLWEQANGADLLKGQGRTGGYASDYKLWKRFARHSRLETICTMFSAFNITRGQISETFRDKYLRECGVKSQVHRPNRILHLMWRLYSSLNLSKALKLD